MDDKPSFTCRMYEEKYPEVDEVVMVQVKSIAEMGAYVSLLEYNNIDGMILLSELSRRRIRSVNKLIKVGRQEPVMVLRVDAEKGYIDLSKRRVSPEDAQACVEKYNKSKLVHTITRHTAETTNTDLEDLYKAFTWPLYKKYGHAHDAFTQMVSSPEDMFTESIAISGEEGAAVLTQEVRSAIVKDIKRRLTPTPLKIRADIELTCFHYDGVLHIKVSSPFEEFESPAGRVKCDNDDKQQLCTSVRSQNLLIVLLPTTFYLSPHLSRRLGLGLGRCKVARRPQLGFTRGRVSTDTQEC